MRTHPDFQIGNTESPMPKIAIGRYASFSCPSFDSLRMKSPEHGGSGGTVEKWFNTVMDLGGRRRRQTESLGLQQ